MLQEMMSRQQYTYCMASNWLFWKSMNKILSNEPYTSIIRLLLMKGGRLHRGQYPSKSIILSRKSKVKKSDNSSKIFNIRLQKTLKVKNLSTTMFIDIVFYIIEGAMKEWRYCGKGAVYILIKHQNVSSAVGHTKVLSSQKPLYKEINLISL